MKFEKPLTNMEKTYKIPEREIEFDFARSSGPGGQNVNKRSTKVIVRWNVGASEIFNDEQKERIRALLGKKINENDEMIIQVQEERSQHQNKEIAVERLNNLVSSAIIPPKKRVPTKPTKSSVERRI